ncbi:MULTISPECIES: hypothetical protein [unclassified Dyella]|uniref:hypothetical protein n=1 Tax=unclassified Dyella TaxID=2634549 RepID=UPI000C81ECF2|nr:MULTISPECIES: hypothetical protein [unclassified Dyella]MDR3446719.1 hypothetical protein [Dyella sp.]PMQ03253.1 hypothetical protein DyAD56_21250 [Dyella sp. AD56]
MRIRDVLEQDDINHLFWLGWGQLKVVPMVNARRLVARNLLEPALSFDGASVAGIIDYYVRITRAGMRKMDDVSAGRDIRFCAPNV